MDIKKLKITVIDFPYIIEERLMDNTNLPKVVVDIVTSYFPEDGKYRFSKKKVKKIIDECVRMKITPMIGVDWCIKTHTFSHSYNENEVKNGVKKESIGSIGYGRLLDHFTKLYTPTTLKYNIKFMYILSEYIMRQLKRKYLTLGEKDEHYKRYFKRMKTHQTHWEMEYLTLHHEAIKEEIEAERLDWME